MKAFQGHSQAFHSTVGILGVEESHDSTADTGDIVGDIKDRLFAALSRNTDVPALEGTLNLQCCSHPTVPLCPQCESHRCWSSTQPQSRSHAKHCQTLHHRLPLPAGVWHSAFCSSAGWNDSSLASFGKESGSPHTPAEILPPPREG